MTTVPAAGQHVLLVDVRTGSRSRTIVDDDLAADHVLLQSPLGTGGRPIAALPVGTPLLVCWTTAAGRHERDATLLEVQRGRRELWLLAAEGAARTTQLRRYARATDSLRGELTRGRDRWPTVLSDLSEGGARALVADPTGLSADDVVLLYLTIEDQRLQLPGRLLPFAPAQVGRTELRLEFADIGRAADVIRRRVLALQIRARAARSSRSRA